MTEPVNEESKADWQQPPQHLLMEIIDKKVAEILNHNYSSIIEAASPEPLEDPVEVLKKSFFSWRTFSTPFKVCIFFPMFKSFILTLLNILTNSSIFSDTIID